MNPVVLIDKRVLARIDAWAAYQREVGLREPTAVAVIANQRGAILLLKAVSLDWWSFPQGNVRTGEGVIDALFRSVDEKAGIPAEKLVVKRFIRAARSRTQEGKRVVTGKCFFYFDAWIGGIPKVTLQPAEVQDYRWLKPLEAAQFLTEQNRERYRQTTDLLRARAGSERE